MSEQVGKVREENFEGGGGSWMVVTQFGVVRLCVSHPSAETLLPCEFCEELYPEGDLILHQVGRPVFWA